MTQDEKWNIKYQEVKDFIETNQRNPSKYTGEERTLVNWLKQQRKLLNAESLKENRVERFKELMELCDKYRHVNQYK